MLAISKTLLYVLGKDRHKPSHQGERSSMTAVRKHKQVEMAYAVPACFACLGESFGMLGLGRNWNQRDYAIESEAQGGNPDV